jgi:FtsH-binding integral membrane protein
LTGQSVKPFVKKLEDNNRLVRILLTTMGIFLGMMALGFYDSQNLLGFGPYLFMGLIGLILVTVILYVITTPEQRKQLQINYYTDLFGIALFAVYIAYNTQIIKEQAKTCQSQLNRGVQPDYPRDSLSLFLNVINLFTHLASANN